MSAAAIRLLLLADAPDDGGEARAALQLPPAPGGRPAMLVFSSIAAAIAAKRGLERAAAAEAAR
jgi:hypothetical protein